ncbi:BLUE COPPER PROTEIN [Salix koriyanagi]|uniref:BLUE COPPER PROTEIN n=1 Tax=Salix koriyanagi TaxID=2511006 RepID=A0A9Q0X5V6_9ROSI|nr:BLUE COPPER PROTEIN [Salix koriyanagi]
MESSRKMLLVLTTMVVTVHVVNASLVYVGGGKETWRPNVNFSEWSARQNIYVGDWLYFGFDKKLYNVLEVNKTGYEGGMKVAINVENLQPSPSPSLLTGFKQNKNGSPSKFDGHVVTVMAVLTGVLLAWAIL